MRLFTSTLMLLSLVFILTAGVIAPCAAQGLLAKNYPVVDSLIRFPASERDLIVLCKKRIAERDVTFVGTAGSDQVLLAAVTLDPISDVKTDISLTVQYDGITPTPGKVQTWSYCYDRNQDGKIDYLALLGGAAPVWGDDMPKYYPNRNVSMDREQMELMINHGKLLFNHWADDNFDGKLDGVVHVDRFQERDWIKRRLIVRSAKFNDIYDDVSSFRKLPGDIEDSIEVYDDGVPYYALGKEEQEMIGKKMFDEKNNILTLLNLAVEQCKLGKNLQGITRKTPMEE